MFFCPKCGSVMLVKSGVIVCPKCGISIGSNPSVAQYLKKSTHFVKVYEKKMDVEGVGVPTSAILVDSVVCPRCGYRKVYYWRRHRSSAESSDVIEKVFKCSSCGYTWSEAE